MNTETEFNMDALLDGTIDDLADMPEFKPFNPGIHRCTVKMYQQKINDLPAISVDLKVIETVETATGVEPMLAGAETTCSYFMRYPSNPIVAGLGQGKFKELLAAAAVKFGAKSNRELMEDINGAEFLVVTGLRDNKKKTQKFTDILEWSVV